MKTYAKFGVLVALIIGTLMWLSAGGIQETATYYKTISEIGQMGTRAEGKRLRVGGDIEAGSIVRSGREVRFVLIQADEQTKATHRLNVVYSGTDPLPDTFRDGAQALADGKLLANQTFEANRIQAKCASKYEGKPGQKPLATAAARS